MPKKKEPVDDYSAYVGMGHNNPPQDMSEITKLAERQWEAQKKFDQLEKDLEAAKNELERLSEVLVPDKMEELGLEEITTSSGIMVSVSEKVRGGLLKENRPKGFAWLEENGHGAIIKSEVVVSFGRKELQDANKLVEELRKDKKLASLEREVHHSTLDAFIREQLEKGKKIPLDIFSVMRQRISQVKIK